MLVGVPSEKVTIYTLPIHFNKVLTGSHGGDAVPQVDIPRLIRLNQMAVSPEPCVNLLAFRL